jgi:hypothetical protein
VKAGEAEVDSGKLKAMPQTRRKREATCMRVVRRGARTTPGWEVC